VADKRDELLGHEADGIREFDNALPRWWLYGFYVTIAFAILYLVNYHVLPRPLVGERTLTAEYDASVRLVSAATPRPPSSAAAIVRPLTDQASLEKGRAIFEGPTNVCFSCHRADLGGLVGPNLTDDFWIHGCTPAELVANVKSGFPSRGMMPFGTGQHLSDDQVLQVVSYVLSRHDTHPASPKAVDPDRDQRCEGSRTRHDDDHDHDHDRH
jgi:cytochrome c oxidase cbb3-type subunit 3